MDPNAQAQAANDTTVIPATAENQPTTPLTQRDNLEQLLENPDWQPEAVPALGAEEGAERPAGEQPQDGKDKQPVEKIDDTKVDDEPDKAQRFRFTDAADRQFAVLRKEGVAPTEAARIAYGIGAQAKAGGEIPGLDDTAKPDPLKSLQDELAAVDKQLKDAAEAGAGLIDGDIIALIQKRSDLAADIKSESRLRGRDTQARDQQQAQAAAEVKAAQRTAVGEAGQRFPGLSQEGTAIRLEADRLTALYHGSALMQDPAAPIQIAEQAALNVARAAAKTNGTTLEAEMGKVEAAGAAKPAVVQKKVIPASGANRTQRPDQPATEEEKFSGVTTLDPREKRNALETLLYGT